MLHLNHHNQSPLKDHRLIYAEPTHADLAEFSNSPAFEDKVKEHYDKKTAELAKEIEALEKAGKNDQEIRRELKSKQTKIAIEAFNQALKDLKITFEDNKKQVQVNYFHLTNHSDAGVSARAAKIFEQFRDSYTPDVDKAVDQYNKEKIAVTGAAVTALTSIPKPAERVDLDAANPETARLQDILDQRAGVIDKGRADRAAMLAEKSLAYKGRTNAIEAMTNPEGGKIDDYDDGFFGKENDYTSYTRARLNGYLYASDIFAGGGEAGKIAVEEAIQKPYELYHSRVIGDSRFTKKDLEESLQLQSYLEKVKMYTTFNEKGVRYDRVLGTMAGLLKLTDDVVKDKKLHDDYEKYLKTEFASIDKNDDLKNNEERQIQFLYGLKSFAEFIEANNNWRTEFAKIADRTDPDREGEDVIDDYPDSGVFNVFGDDLNRVNNSVREGLNGYLYSVHLFTGGNQNAINAEYQRAFTMFEDVAGDMFEQEHLDRESKGPDGDDDGFGLSQFAIEGDAYTDHPAVKYTIAGLLKQTEGIGDATQRKSYRDHLDSKFKALKKGDSLEAQMTILSTIKSPTESELEFKYNLHSHIMKAVIEATKQHNQFVLDPKLTTELEKDPKTVSPDDYSKLASAIKTSIDGFVTTRADADLKDMESRFNILIANNAKLKEPLYSATELQEVRKRIEDNAKEFAKAKGIVSEGDLDKAMSAGFLRDLTIAEKTCFDITDDLNARMAAVQEQAKGAAPDQLPPVLPPVTEEEGGEETPEEITDSIEKNWASAERETPEMGNYVGPLIADSFSDSEKVEIRDSKGKLIGHLENGEEVKRTAADAKEMARNVEGISFIRIHWHGKAVWSPEEQLFKKDDFENTTPPETQPPKPPETPPSRPPEVAPPGPRLTASYLDRVFASPETPFQFTYNGKPTNCRVLKGFDGYHLNVSHPDTGNSDHVFRSLNEARAFIEYGGLIRDLAMRMIMDKNIWNRYRSSKWLDRVKEIKRTGPFSMFVELDWKRNVATETGNGKIELNVNPDGSIFYRIAKDYVGPNGENFREGTVGDQTQLVDAINHAKNWSENYRANKRRNPDFGALENRERLNHTVTDIRTYLAMGHEIGEPFYFHNFENYGYAYMTLDWDGSRDLAQRHRSLTNPILEVKLTSQNTLAWKLTNQTGPQGQRVGLSAVARDFNELARQIAGARANANNALSMPLHLLPNLGNLGYSLT